MLSTAIRIMILMGSGLMVFNIYNYISYARRIKALMNWDREGRILYLPIVLLIFFLLGYVFVGFLGKPDLVMGGILFGGSIFVYLMYIFIDQVTSRILDNERIKAEMIASERSNRAKSDFLHSVSHEMRTPMNVIIGLDTIALKNDRLMPETRDHLVKIGLSARLLLDFINNILEINSMEAGTLTVRHERFSMNDISAQLNAIMGTLCSEKGLSWHFSLEEGAGGYYLGDELLIKQVIMNILNNAVKFTAPPGDIYFDISLADSQTDDRRQLQFRVRDTGIGIDPDFLPHIFDAFSREDESSTSSYGGGGLSLSISKGIIDRMGGTITVESGKNTGSTFVVTIPLDYDGQGDETVPEPDESSEETELLSGLRILVVDDLSANAEIVLDLLELEGAIGEHAENGVDAYEMFTTNPEHYYDAILMDLRMPIMDGLEATRKIRSYDRPDAATIPIIALSANTAEIDVKQSLESGMNVHLGKPVDPDLMYHTIKDLTSNRS